MSISCGKKKCKLYEQINIMNKLKSLENFLNKYKEISSNYNEQRINSKEFNIFNLINQIYGIGETKHSKFLAFLLDVTADHGQGNLFLNEFLKLLEIKNTDDANWTVTAEKNNIDILLKCSHPVKSTIIIENKSNWAIDQNNQLYRYWFNEIYDGNTECEYENAEDVLGVNDRIIYLAPNPYKTYDAKSIVRPENNSCKLAALYPKNITHLYFYSHINEWLINCKNINGLPIRIKYFIDDYLQFWQETNFKDEMYMTEIKNYFTDKQENWIDFVQSSKYITLINEEWLKRLVNQFAHFPIGEWKYESFKPDDNEISLNDFRWFVNLNSDLCFVYEYHKGLTIWKKEFSELKQNYKKKFEDYFPNFTFLNDNTNYIMKFNDDSLVFKSVEEFTWNAGNTNLAERIKEILQNYLNNDVKEFFNTIDNELR